MDTKHASDEQAKLWNGLAARGWIEAQELIDHTFKPFEDLLVNAVSAERPHRVLDVGCGTGGTTVAVARALDGDGRAVGLDISEPMLAAARARAERERTPADFIRADAQVYPFEAATFDMIVSRFGVMFFEDPVAAFANLRRAAIANAVLQVVVFRSPAENPFMTTAEHLAAPLMPKLLPRDPRAPGQFALADHQRVQLILEQSGWTKIEITPIDVVCTMPEQALVGYLTRFGPVGRALDDVDEPTRSRVIATVRAGFDRYVFGKDVRFTAACWSVAARK
jgi:SAM-dependent methyltransferase